MLAMAPDEPVWVSVSVSAAMQRAIVSRGSPDPSETIPSGKPHFSVQRRLSIALGERAGIAIACSHALAESSASLCRTSRVAIRHGKVLWRAREDIRILHAGFDSGCITTRSRNRVAASTESVDGPEASTTADGFWAHRTVFASRIIAGKNSRGTGTIDDPASETWHVREIDARHIPGAKAERCLVFENRERVRRLWSYPENWETLPPPELLALAGIA